MTTTTLTAEEVEASEILERAQKLPTHLQHDIAHVLLGGPVTDTEYEAERAALNAELTRRWERLRSGEDKGHSIEEVIAALREQNEARRR